MKIHKLRFGNLNSLVGEWEIDFNDKAFQANSIFAITGPTGSGKTTILDAICLALYGMTPRLSRINQSTNEIMSRQSGNCFAELLFETHQGTFRAHWSQRRAKDKANGNLQVYKHEVSDALKGQVLESKASQVPELIKEISGMDFEQFTRSILLAQGDFAAFLQASPDERAPILEQITGTGIYTRISQKVHERTREEKKRLDELTMQEAVIQVLSEEEETGLVQQIKLQIEEKNAEDKRQVALDQGIKCLDGISALEEELAFLDSAWEDFQQRKGAFEPQRQRLELGGKALLLDGPYAVLSGLREQQQNEIKRLEDLQEQIPEQSRIRGNAWREVEELAVQVGKLKEQQRNELAKIKKVRELDLQLRQGAASIKQCQAEMEAFKQKVQQIQKEMEQAQKQLEQHQEDLEECQDYLVKKQADQSLLSNFTGIDKTLLGLLNRAAQLDRAKSEVKEAEKLRLVAKKSYQDQEDRYEELKKYLKSREEEWENLKQAIKSLKGELDYPAWLLELQDRRERQTLLEKIQLLIKQRDDSLQKQALWTQAENLRQEKQAQLAEEIPHWRLQCNHYEQDGERLQTQIQLLSRIRDLETERQYLQDGQPCPLCGSIHHPYAQGQIPHLDQSERELGQVRKALKQAQKELSTRELEHGRVLTEMNHITQALQEEKANYLGLDQQYRENIAKLKLRLPKADEASFIQNLLEELKISIAELKGTIAQIEEKLRKEKELKTSWETIKAAVLARERLCQQSHSELALAMHREDELGKKAEGIQNELDALQQEVMQELAPYGIEQLQMQEVNLIREQLQQRQAAWIQHQKRKEQVEQGIGLLDQEIRQQAKQLKASLEEQAYLGRKLEASEEIQNHIEQNRLDLYGEEDPDVEERRIQDQLTASENELNRAKEDFIAIDSHLKQMQEQMEELRASTGKREPVLAEEEKEFRQSMALSGFINEDEYLQARLPEGEQKELAQQAGALSREETELETRCHDKKKAWEAEKEKNLSEASREELEGELIQSKQKVEKLNKGIIESQLNLENNLINQAKLAKLKEQLEKHRKEYHRWELLNQLIGSHDGKRYRNFAQGVTFDLMAAYANRQLCKMSDRYLLIRDSKQSLALNVIDNYQAGEIRSTKNLSGGESFLVSLALALGLSQMASQNVRVDSLFLDEGFGALDDEALDTALNTLAGLEQEGKMIGVISHVPALKERISTQIQVIPQSGGCSILQGPGCRLITP